MKKLRSFLCQPFSEGDRQQGMTIIEILIVIALMSTIMAVLVTNLLDKSDSAKADLTEVLVSKLNESLTIYKIDTGRFPTTEDGLKALLEAPSTVRNWKGPYTEPDKLNDIWGHALQYELINSKKFKIASAGIDGEFGTDDDILFPKDSKKPEKDPLTVELKVPEGNLRGAD